jgi:hypothetical protein
MPPTKCLQHAHSNSLKRPGFPGAPMSLDSLEKLFVEELRDIYNAEKQLPRHGDVGSAASL